jgi:hypothetical protein
MDDLFPVSENPFGGDFENPRELNPEGAFENWLDPPGHSGDTNGWFSSDSFTFT